MTRPVLSFRMRYVIERLSSPLNFCFHCSVVPNAYILGRLWPVASQESGLIRAFSHHYTYRSAALLPDH
jgi:hypothetical protein